MIGCQARRIIARETRRLSFNQSSSMAHCCIFFRAK